MKNVSRIVVVCAAAALFSATAVAQDAAAAAPAANQDCEAAKTDPNLYTKWLENRGKAGEAPDAAKQKIAYDAGKAFLAKCEGVSGDAYVAAVQKWVGRYDEAVGKFAVRQRFEDAAKAVDAAPAGSKNYVPLFAAGKEYVAAEPENLAPLLALTNIGVLNSTAGETANKSLDPDAIAFARRALALVEAGKGSPADFKVLGAANKDEAVTGLNYRLGILTRNSAPDEAANYLLKVAQSNGPLKSDPSLYFYLAQAYAAGEYKRLADDYNMRFAGKEETDESRLAQAKLTASLNRILDAYARSIAYNTKTDADSVKFKNNTTATLTSLYKQSHNNSDAGLTQFISESATRRLPLPNDPVPTPAPVAAPSTPATGTTTPAATGATGTATGTTPAAKPKP